MGMIPVYGAFNEHDWLADAKARRLQPKPEQLPVIDLEPCFDPVEAQRIWKLIEDASK